ncbi:hypothetical protein PPL_00099 [Heterostelium album PN500]|uniref:UDENN FNIP1/2-type domain-containing protein n=1 Tax=Heterostelium pallidum (strain ATCC 26659 / Pp 5 / PN500) TaxID=670386 RepID=D3AVI6_HETP5|nr:hypothetical protein PPL_00099 [Heterostelium album PN500]EFA86309.1 hypothetical protein PPL_00099 [Heterostelium album PN500]|eukprot:XP_020438414.1 hypothetical protein PPL_00099 [Heterostelium album PN500]
MDFFRIFSKDSNSTTSTSSIPNKINSSDLNDHIRLVAYQNSCSILFDTLQIDAIKLNQGKTTASGGTTPTTTPHSNGTAHKSPAKPRGKVEMLKEMMFGTVPLNIQGTTTKIHYLPDSNQMLLTKLFTLNLTKDEPTTTSNSAPQSPVVNNATSQQKQTTTPTTTTTTSSTTSSTTTSAKEEQQQSGMTLSSSDLPSYSNGSGSSNNVTGENKSNSTTLLPSSPSKTTDHIPSSTKSATLTTSMPSTSNIGGGGGGGSGGITGSNTLNNSTGSSNNINNNNNNNNINNNRARSSSTLGRTNRPMMMMSSAPKVKKVTLALCVIFGPKNLDDLTNTPLQNQQSAQMQQISKFHQFIITHFVLIDMRLQPMIKLLKNQLYSKFTTQTHGSMSAYGMSEVNQIYKEIEKFRNYINDLYSVPRLEKPLWIDTIVFPSTKRQTYKILLELLRELIPSFNTPKSRYFLSNLITTVLSYNLTWMSNMLSTDSSTSYRCSSEKCNSFISFENQFLNQISEIYGYTGCLNPRCCESSKNNRSHYRMVKSIVIGAPDISKKLLQIISYFWRSFELILNRHMLDYRSNLYDQDELHRSFTLPTEASSSSSGNLSTSPASPTRTPHNNQHQYPTTPNSHHHQNGNGVQQHHRPTVMSTPNKQTTSTTTTTSITTPSKSMSPPSSTSTADTNHFQFGSDDPSLPSYYHDLSRSLLGSHTNKYVSDMALLAVPKYDFFTKMIDDLRLWNDNNPFPSHLKESICIVADVSKNTCDAILVSRDHIMSDTNPIVVNGVAYPDVKILKGVHSEYINHVLTTLVSFWQIGMHPETCIIYLEDKLRELFMKSLTYYETIRLYSSAGRPIPPTISQLSTGVSTPSTSTFTTPLATPSTSPHSSVPSYNALRLQMTGDQILIEGIYTYLMSCHPKTLPNEKSANNTLND